MYLELRKTPSFMPVIILNGSTAVTGNTVVVIGGGITGAETALELNARGKKVTIVEMTDAFLADLVPLVRHILQRSMKQT